MAQWTERFMDRPDGFPTMTGFSTLQEAEDRLVEEFGLCDQRRVVNDRQVEHLWFPEGGDNGMAIEVNRFGANPRWVVIEVGQGSFRPIIFDEEGVA